ncbi:hypothetical protein [Jeotgalibacillus malaysiensis]|uniref:hypothetical protein n=1 Tax=Jeotgalibacillus malaysiensis TaxID=1508404 RepID=UPI00384FCC2B
MPRLTTIFDIQDRMSRKLRLITGNLEKVERITSKPITISLNDRATRHAKRITKFIRSDIAKTHNMVITGRDMVTSRVLRPISSFMERRMPRTHTMIIRGMDRATPVFMRIQRLSKGLFNSGYNLTIRAMDRVTPVINRITTYAKAAFHKGFTLSVRTLDLATTGLRHIANYARSAVGRTYTLTVRALDLASRPLRAISNLATSTVGILGAAGGVYGGVVAPLNMVMDRQGTETAFEVLLGSAEDAQKRVAELTTFAGQTPFTRDEIYKSSRLLETFTGSALSTGEGLKLVGDVAAGTQTDFQETAMWFGRLYDGLKSGRPVGEATMRLQEMGAISGEARANLEELAESGRDISEVWPEAAREFERYSGMMDKLSDNLQNLLLGAKQFFVQNMMMRWGEGLENALSPALQAFREWRGENKAAIAEMGNEFERMGEKAAKAFLNPVSAAGSFLSDQFKILFPVNDKMREMAVHDPEIGRIVAQQDGMSFEARMDIVIDNTKDAFGQWWENTGQGQLNKVAGKIGSTYGGIINGVVNGVFGAENESSGNAFVDAGMEAGKTFADSFIDALDPVSLSERIGKKIAEINVNAGKSAWGKITGNEELAGSGSIGGAVLTNLLFLAGASKLLTTFAPVGKGLKGGFGLGKKAWGKMFGKKGGTDNVPSSPKGPSMFDRAKGWLPFGAVPDIGEGKAPKEGMFGKALKKVPVLGTGLAAAGLMATPKEMLPEAVGSLTGGMAGASVGAAVGSIIPGIGTLIGGLIGGVLGSIGLGKVGEWLGDLDWSGIGQTLSNGFSSSVDWLKEFSADIGESVSNGFNSAIDWIVESWNSFTSWMNDSVWTPIQDAANSAADFVSNKWGEFTSWFDSNVWTPIKNAGINTMNFFVGLFVLTKAGILGAWIVVKTWFNENVWTPIKDYGSQAIDFLSEKFTQGKEWLQEKWGQLSTWFSETVWTPIKTAAIITGVFIYTKLLEAYIWVKETWNQAWTWFEETVWIPLKNSVTSAAMWTWTKLQEAWTWITETWSAAWTWFETTVWIPLKTSVTSAALWLWTKLNEAWVWIQETWTAAWTWFDTNVWTPIETGATEAADWIWTKLEESWGFVTETWSAVSGWFEKNVWSPVEGAASRVAEFVSGAFETAAENVKTLFGGIETAWNTVSGWASKGVGMLQEGYGSVTRLGENVTGKSPNRAANNYRGGLINQKQLSWVGERGKEFIIPVDTYQDRGKRLLGQAASALGMTVNEPGSENVSASRAAVVQSSGSGSKSVSVKKEVNVNLQGDQYFSQEEDWDTFKKKVREAVEEAIDDDEFEEGGVYVG